MALSVQNVVALKKELESRDSARNSSYDEVVRFYSGTDYRTAKKQGFISGITQAVSSIFTPKAADEDAALSTPINLVKPAIEAKVAFLALPPTVRVIEPPDTLAPTGPSSTQPPAAEAPGATAPPSTTGAAEATGLPGAAPLPGAPAPTPTPGAPELPPPIPVPEDWGVNLADRLEAVVASLMNFSNMPKRCRDVAWSMCAMDGAVIGVWPDFKHERPRIFTRTPQDFWPVAYDADGLELSKAVWMDTMNGHEIEARWGNKKYVGRQDVEVIQCIDEEKFYTVLDGKEWAHPPVDNILGVVPIVCVGALGVPGQIFGGNDIKDAIPVAKQINYHMYLIDEMAGAMVRPTIAVKDPLNVPDDIAIGRGGTITMGPNGSVDLLGPISLPNAFWQLSGTLQNWFDLISDNPAVLRSEGAGSIVTGKGFNAQLGPIAARMQTRLEIIMSAWRQALKYMLLMWANFPGANGTLKVAGTKGIMGKDVFYIEATPDEFMVNGEMWTEMEVFLSAQSYMDRQGNAVELMQLYQNELLDWNSVADNLPQVTNKARVRANIDRDRKWKAEGMAMAQQVQQSAMTANVAPGAQELTNYQLERGFLGETGAPPMPDGSAGPAAPPADASAAEPAEAAPAGGNELVSILQEFFSSIGKLRGAVWFGGDPLLAPEKFASDNWSVTIWVTDPQDKGTITRAAAKVPEIYGHVKFIEGEPSPDEQTIQVSQGAANEAPQETPPEAMLGAPPADMMGGL